MMWAIKWRQDNKLEGKREYLLGLHGLQDVEVPNFVAGYSSMAFATRKEARAYIKKRYGYFNERPDLKAEPYGWKMPIAVKVSVEIIEITTPEIIICDPT